MSKPGVTKGPSCKHYPRLNVSTLTDVDNHRIAFLCRACGESFTMPDREYFTGVWTCQESWCQLPPDHEGPHDNECGGRPGKPCGSCDCFMDTHPDDPFGLHPEMFTIGRPP